MASPFILELNVKATLTQNPPHLQSTELYPPGKSITLPRSGGKCIHRTLFVWHLASNWSTQWQAAHCSPLYHLPHILQLTLQFYWPHLKCCSCFSQASRHMSHPAKTLLKIQTVLDMVTSCWTRTLHCHLYLWRWGHFIPLTHDNQPMTRSVTWQKNWILQNNIVRTSSCTLKI